MTFRRLAANEHEDLLRHLLRLGAEDRRLRFGGYVGEERLRAYCRRLDRHPGSLVLGCFIAGELRGVGELKPIKGTWPRAAELAVSVEAPFRGRGLGTELCRRLLVRARNRFITRLYMLCLSDNRPVQRMARKLRTKKGRERYAKRKGMIEPIFGQLKQVLGLRQFSMRGLSSMRGEWRLMATVHNLLKLWRHDQRMGMAG